MQQVGLQRPSVIASKYNFVWYMHALMHYCCELALTLGITEGRLVCCPCCNDIAWVLKDLLGGKRKGFVSVQFLTAESFFNKCYIDIVQCLELAGENIPSKLDIALSSAKTITI